MGPKSLSHGEGMLENAVGDGICGGDVKSFDFRMQAGCEGETPSPQPAGDAGATFTLCKFILLI